MAGGGSGGRTGNRQGSLPLLLARRAGGATTPAASRSHQGPQWGQHGGQGVAETRDQYVSRRGCQRRSWDATRKGCLGTSG